jgi:SAM-dependent methyltransferase
MLDFRARARRVIRQVIPSPVKQFLRPLYYRLAKPDKYKSELAYWQDRYVLDGGRFHNSHYQRLMLALAGETSDDFLRGKVVADFGCGPRGSLAWARSASERIGIDILADAYAQHFDLSSHQMRYVTSTEMQIPLGDQTVDVLVTLNAMDHVNDFPVMCSELLRILRPGGDFLGSFNLEEPPTACEPQMLTEALVKVHLLDHLEITSYRVAGLGPGDNRYLHCFDQTPAPTEGERVLWVRARKP